MSLKNSYVTSDYMEWDSMLSLVRKLYRDKEYRLSLLIGCGSFFGLRISDLLTLTWSLLLDGHSFAIIEKKTGVFTHKPRNPMFVTPLGIALSCIQEKM